MDEIFRVHDPGTRLRCAETQGNLPQPRSMLAKTTSAMTTETLPPLIGSQWLADHIDDPGLRVLDCTTTIQYDAERGIQHVAAAYQAFLDAHIPGAQFVDLQRHLSDPAHHLNFMLPAAEHFAASMQRLGIGDTSRVIIYSTGNIWWATRVWWLLRVFGFDNAAVLDGGLKAWTAAGKPTESGPARPPAPGHFTARSPLPLVATRQDVLQAIGDGSTYIIDALPRPSFAGRVPSAYGRSGHIAGSINVPGIDLVDPVSNLLVPISVIRDRLVTAGVLPAAGSAGAKPVIAYCGGGITATFIAFVFALVGLPDPLIYDASLQEWAADADLPMEKEIVLS